MSKKQSRSTKIALASALAASAIVPAMAVSAEETAVPTSVSTGYKDGTYTIDFKVSDDSIANYVKGPATVEIVDGKMNVVLDLGATMSYFTKLEVNGVNAIVKNGDKSIVKFELADMKPLNISATIVAPFGQNAGQGKDYNFTITLDPTTFKPVVEETTPAPTPVQEKLYKAGKQFSSVLPGTYDIKYDAYKITDEKITGDYKSITSHLEPSAKLIVEEGQYFVELTILKSSNEMVEGLKVTFENGEEFTAESVKGSTKEYPHVLRFPIESIGGLLNASIHVVVPEYKMDKWYDFGFAIETADLVLPQTAPVYVYKEGTNQLSIMQDTYIASDITYTEVDDKYKVELTFPEGQFINDFQFEGKSVAVASSTTNGKSTVKVYTVEVDSLSEIYTATFDLDIPGVYKTKHSAQLQFGGSQNPFGDILKLNNYGKIVSLYSQGIYKENTKFNPAGKVKRSQFALMLQRALNLDVPTATKFADVANMKDTEAADAIKALNTYGVINGVNETTFNPNGEIRRDQTALMIYRLLVKEGFVATTATNPFTDAANLSTEAQTAIAQLNALGIMTGSQGKFNPKNTLTRDQMSKVLFNTLKALDTLN